MRILAVIFLLLSFAANAQRPFSRDFWLNETQSPVNVNAMAEASSGYIWVGTNEGLYRFNGRDFTFIHDSIKRPVTAVACLGNEVYLGYENGVIAKIIKDPLL
jgi:ligand-binding sensor domain-containing protein